MKRIAKRVRKTRTAAPRRRRERAQTAQAKTVGVIGTGRMGLPIVGHLARKRFSVRAHDLDPGKAARVTRLGAAWCADLGELARECEVILCCVGYEAELQQLLLERGVLDAVRPGTIIAVLSTVRPGTIGELARRATESRVHLVDATLCRGPQAADAGTLLAFVGGEPEVVQRLRPVLAAFSTDIVRTGAPGSAQVAKAANNLILWSCLVADHEALALAQRFGVDSKALRSALVTSSADNFALRNWGTNEMAWADDDLKIVADMAAEASISLPQAGLVREICRALRPRRFRLEDYGR